MFSLLKILAVAVIWIKFSTQKFQI